MEKQESCMPPRLVDLAAQSLLEDEAAAVAALQSLPRESFPPLFVLAVAGRRCRTVQAMVEAWPFPYLPLGALLKALPLGALLKALGCHKDILKAALNGIDALLARDFRPTRWKLQVLDLRSDAETNFWHVWAGLGDRVSASPSRESGAAQPSPEKRGVGPSSPGEKQQFASTEVLVLLSDLCFMKPPVDALLPFLVKRVKQNKLIPRLRCRKLEILDEPLENSIMHMILEKVELARVEQVEVNCKWNLVDLALFVPFLGQMIHLNRLFLSGIQVHASISRKVKRLWAKFTTQLSKLQQLQHLDLDFMRSPAGRLHKMFKYLLPPLESLSITNRGLMECDLKYLCTCPNTSQLRRLDLSDQQLTYFNPHYLHTLLERTSATLEHLNLGGCKMTDFQFTTILPALGQCSQLHCFRFPGNTLPMAALENVLRHVLLQRKIRSLEMSFPVECQRIRNLRAFEDWQDMLIMIEVDLGVQLTCFEPDLEPWRSCYSIWFDVQM
ncbi:PREDICTED: melanoma antigen preferentially expressed in tumors-like [Elephantulus edwardii]|uniref:melanoma antigen preferentially expressed in tumors-like n=1 Tax=Elephantulus edwardii TaxID=28737 RepID=UPI0003F08A8D|nr:PREDICTED: melanoma antigen preferentially expressed in tumors-like [Elephantulus edwardii]